MPKYCILASTETNCTESCSVCAKETLRDILDTMPKELLTDKTEEELKCIIGTNAFELLCKHNHISYNDNKYSVIGGN